MTRRRCRRQRVCGQPVEQPVRAGGDFLRARQPQRRCHALRVVARSAHAGGAASRSSASKTRRCRASRPRPCSCSGTKPMRLTTAGACGWEGRLLQRRPVRATRGDIKHQQRWSLRAGRWTVNNRPLTLDLGLRAESEDVPLYRKDNPGVHFNFGDKFAPRVGLAYDVKGDSSVEGVRQLGRVLRSDEADRRARHVRRRQLGELLLPLETFDGRRSRAATDRRAAAVPAPSSRPFDFRPVSNNPEPRPRGSGLEGRALAGAHLRRRSRVDNRDDVARRPLRAQWVDYAIEAVCNFTPDGEEDCGVNNPGFGTWLGKFPFCLNVPGATARRARLRR